MGAARKLWSELDLVAFDLEGTGAQDRENEAILELAVVPITGGEPCVHAAYPTLINPGRPVPRSPWISPVLTGEVLSAAPPAGDVEPAVVDRIRGKYVVGHNVHVDWRLLRLRIPRAEAAGLVDTLKLVRHYRASRRGLAHALEDFALTSEVNRAVPGSRPHRALWDATGAAMLLRLLCSRTAMTAGELLSIAGTPMNPPAEPDNPPTLF